MKNISNIEIGQILWLKVRYQIDVTSETKHPMLIAKIKNDYIEVIALDKTAGKMHQLFHNYNYYIDSNNPKETAIFEDSYAQLNTKLTIEKIENILSEYENYQKNYGIEEQRIVHMTKNEILLLNANLQKSLVSE